MLQKKICLLGDFAVGKTSLVRQWVEGRFDDKYLSSIGVKISRKTLQRVYGDLNLLVWDLAGGEEFNTQAAYLRGVAGALIVCDLTRRPTFLALERYAGQVRTVHARAPLVLVGNKIDLAADRAVSDADLREMGAALGGPFCLASARTGAQVETAFVRLAEQLEGSA